MRVTMVHPSMSHFSALMSDLARGIEANGDKLSSVAQTYGKVDTDALVCWGWRRGKILRRSNPSIPILVMERGYVGDRMHWTSLGWNGLNRRATFPKPPTYAQLEDVPYREPPKLTPWRAREGYSHSPYLIPGEYALILGQVQSDQACVGVNMPSKYREWLGKLTRAGLRVRFRPHPKAARQNHGIDQRFFTRGTLAEDLAGAKFTVSWNSNSSVDSVLAGVPSVTFDEGAMAWPVTSHSLDNPVMMPSRTEWAAQLAWCQWQPSELCDGSAWAAVKEALP
jgi:hypothetical protein